MRIRTFTGRLRTTPNPDFAGRDFRLTWLASVARIFRIAVLAAVRCSLSTRPARKSAHKRSPPDSGLVQKSDGERSPIGARQIEFAASLPLIGNHGLIR
jgi:hypothetical protein